MPLVHPTLLAQPGTRAGPSRLALALALSLALGASTSPAPWDSRLAFGRDSFRYPSWVSEQRSRCSCALSFLSSPDGARPFLSGLDGARHVDCLDAGRPVHWRTATDLTWCSAKHFLLSLMPRFDLDFLPPAVSVDGESMLDDNIAFTLMAWNASSLDPRPPVNVAIAYLLPYATQHESRANWRPLFFAKFFGQISSLRTSAAVLSSLGQQAASPPSRPPPAAATGVTDWASHRWPGFPGRSAVGRYNLGPFAPGSAPPVLAPFDFVAYGYASCTGWAKLLASSLRAVAVPAREVGTPCWNTGPFRGPAVLNPNVSACWGAGDAPGTFQNHNWVEYWDNVAGQWAFVDVAVLPGPPAWFCGQFENGCQCDSNAGRAGPDHDILAPSWSPVGEDLERDGGPVVDVADLRLSSGQRATPLVWAPRLRSPSGRWLASEGLRMVNRTEFYRCKTDRTASIASRV